MTLTLQECIEKIKKEYPNHYPYVYVECEGKYVFNLVAKGADPKTAISDMHVVDPVTGNITGGISIMEFLKDEKFREAWKHANLVSNHDDNLSHSIDYKLSHDRKWRVRRNQNSRDVLPFDSEANDYEPITYGGSLEHYGVKGQKWGTQNGPPYPLDKKLRNQMAKDASNGKAGMDPAMATVAAELGFTILSFLAVTAMSAYASSPKQVLKQKTREQDTFNSKNKSLSEDLIGDIADLDKKYTEDNPPRKIEGTHSIEDDMAACNPRYKNGVVPGTSVNCTLCSFVYDLRRRGYDVTALCSSTGNYPDIIAKNLYKDYKEETVNGKNFSEIYRNAAEKYPEGSRGSIAVLGRYMAHSMAWEIRDGKLEVLDTQRNVRMTPQDLSTYGFYASTGVKMIRTDNLDVNYEGINLVGAELKPGWKKTIAAEKKAAASVSQKAAGIGIGVTAAQRKMIEQYKQEHPNSKLSNKEILKNLV